tara:strand:+ start:586 stop:1296 length:711 start_codon:yes stop_codon:yes gene_type:complete
MVSLGKWIILGLAGAFALSALVDPQRAYATTQAFSGVGSALGSLGGGVQSLLSGVGTGTAKLFNPLFTLRDLIYGPQAGVQVQADISQVSETGNIHTSQIAAQQRAIELDPYAPFTPITTGFGGVPLGTPPNYSVEKSEEGAAIAADKTLQGYSYHFKPSISPQPIAQVSVHGQSLPLSQAAISHYQALGVTVSPEVNQSVASQNSGNATSVSSASSNYQAGAAQAAGYSLGKPRR